MPIYRQILSSAWQVLWRRPWIWLLGLLAAMLGNTGEYQLLLNAFDRLSNPTQNWWWPNVWQTTYAANTGNWWVVAVILVLLLVLLIWLAVTSTGGLFYASSGLVKNEKVGLGTAWQQGQKYFWPVLGLVIIGKGLTIVLLMVAVAPLFLATATASSNTAVMLYSLLAFLIFVPLSIIISFATKYGVAYAVLKQQPLGHALFNGWKLFWKNWLVSIEMAVILFAVSLLLSLVLVIISIVSLVVVLSLNTVLGTMGVPVLMGMGGFLVLRVIASLIALPFVLFVAAALAVFQVASWTILFHRLTNEGVVPKLLRFFKRTPTSSSLFKKTAAKRLRKVN